METCNPALGTKLKELRNGKPIHTVEQESGVYNISRYEKGIYQPKDEVLKTLAAYYKADFRTLYKLKLEDAFPLGSEKRDILLEWLQDNQ
jgi:transcriptional regulator with XRE-family HTH domain